jgi:hypothetical protein
METRFTNAQITFHQPFKLPSLAAELPAGTYSIDTEEEEIEGAEEKTWRPLTTALRLIAPGANASYMQVDPTELAAALKHDEAQPGAGPPKLGMRGGRPRFARR